MSGGPIKQWRDSWLPERVSAVDGERVCAQIPGTLRAECGRKPKHLAIPGNSDTVTCPECRAAIAADSTTPDTEQGA